MPRPTWETERRVKPDIWRGNNSQRSTDESGSNINDSSFGRISRRVMLEDEILHDSDSSSSTSDSSDGPGAFAIHRGDVDEELQWDPTVSLSSHLCIPEEDPLRQGVDNMSQAASSHKDDIAQFFVMEKDNQSANTRFGCLEKKTKEFKWLIVLGVIFVTLVVAVVTAFLISSKIKRKNNSNIVLPPVGICDFSSSTKDVQIDPFLQCECTQRIDIILDSVIMAHEAIRAAANITESEIDVHSCSPENLALLWAAMDVALNNYSLETGVTRYALGYMYWTWGGDEWDTKDNWVDSKTPECIWFGVGCDKEGAVVALELSGNNLQGEVKNQLGLIKGLKRINLSANHLKGTIQHDWWKLSNLVSLNLNGNKISGETPALANSDGEALLPFLEELHLAGNQVNGSIYRSFDNVTTLKALDMTLNLINGNFPSFSSTSSLQRLLLGNTYLSGLIPTAWTRLSLLKELNLLNLENAIGNFSVVNQMTGLRSLDIGGAGSWGQLPKSIGTLSLLEYLAVNYAFNSGTMPTDMHLLTKLKYFNIAGNQVKGTIPTEIGRCSNLEELLLGPSSLTGMLPTEFGSLTSLTLLDLSFTFLQGTLPSQLGSLHNLTSLVVFNSGIQGAMPKEICSSNVLSITSSEGQFIECSCCNYN